MMSCQPLPPKRKTVAKSSAKAKAKGPKPATKAKAKSKASPKPSRPIADPSTSGSIMSRRHVYSRAYHRMISQQKAAGIVGEDAKKAARAAGHSACEELGL